MAESLGKAINKNSVTIKTTPKNGQERAIRYDLLSNPARKGSHYSKIQSKDVKTPHKVVETKKINTNPQTGRSFPRKMTGDTKDMSKNDVRVVRKYIQKQPKK